MDASGSQPGTVLANMVHQATIDALAAGRVYERGATYLREGRVGPIRRRGRRLAAEVRGSAIYHVELWAKGTSLAYACTCPWAQEGFCKHCVAVALAWLAARPSPSDPHDDFDRDAFLDEVVARASADPVLRASLLERLARLS